MEECFGLFVALALQKPSQKDGDAGNKVAHFDVKENIPLHNHLLVDGFGTNFWVRHVDILLNTSPKILSQDIDNAVSLLVRVHLGVVLKTSQQSMGSTVTRDCFIYLIH